MQGACLEHKTLLVGDYSYYCKKKYGDNYALVGDAGAFLDPIFSSGIYVGMHSAGLVASAVDIVLKGGNGKEALDDAYKQINGGIDLLEKFIRLFYVPDLLNLSEVGNPEKELYDKFEMAYTILHYLLAGDFFENHEKYSSFIDEIRNEKTLMKFQALIRHKKEGSPEADCGELYEEMYGEMTHKIAFDKSIL